MNREAQVMARWKVSAALIAAAASAIFTQPNIHPEPYS